MQKQLSITIKINDVLELQRIQRLACSVPEDVFLCALDDTVKVDAKSFINLFTLDLSQPVKLVTASEKLVDELQVS